MLSAEDRKQGGSPSNSDGAAPLVLERLDQTDLTQMNADIESILKATVKATPEDRHGRRRTN